MNCGEVEKRLTVDSSAALDLDVRGHVEHCESCAELCRQLTEIEELNQALARGCGAPMDFSGKVATLISRRRSWSGFSTLATVMASLLIVAVAVDWPEGPAQASPPAALLSSMVEESQESDLGITVNEQAEGPRPTYVEVILLEPSGDPYVVQIPSTIKIRRTDAARGALLKVSH